MSAPILDSFGRSATYIPSGSMYEGVQDSNLRMSRPNLAGDIASLLNRYKHQMLLSDSRYVVSTFPVLSGAIEQKADYVGSAGFSARFAAEDTKWSRTASDGLESAHSVCNARGSIFTWERSWKIASRLLDIDGGFFILLGRAPSGWPVVQFFEAHRIGSRGETIVESGPYKGLRILNGIIYNDSGREVAYRVLGSKPEEDRDISAMDMIHVCEPRWYSDGRPFPNVAYAILDWYDAKETRGFQRIKQKVNSALTMVETTEDGKAPVDAALSTARGQRGTATAPRPLEIKMLDGGLIRYVKSGGGSIETHTDNTPGDGWLKFDQRIIAGAFYGIGWRYEMMDPSALSGAPTRGFADQINTAIHARWLTLSKCLKRVDGFLLSCLIDIGEVPPHAEWMKFGYVPPADFTVDQGRSSKADIDNVRAGADTIPSVVGRYGRSAEEVLEEQAKYLKLKAAIEAKHGLAPGSLGSLSQPGMTAPQDSAQPSPDQTN
jgi:hypothetical protein